MVDTFSPLLTLFCLFDIPQVREHLEKYERDNQESFDYRRKAIQRRYTIASVNPVADFRASL